MEFKKYSEIENNYNKKFLGYIYHSGIEDGEWVVEEKVHGANLAIYVDESDIAYAKRSSFIEGDDFYDISEVKKNESKYREVRKDIGENIIIYGEVFGGNYPVEGVEKSNTKAIQKGIYYKNTIDFYAFDIYTKEGFLEVFKRNDILRRNGILYAEPLLTGTLKECLDFDIKFETRLPEKFGLPRIENNMAEGIVIKPVKPKFFNSGKRVIIKKKNEERKEVKEVQEKEENDELSSMVRKYVNENRLDSAISKIGPLENKNFPEVLKEMNRDVREEIGKIERKFDKEEEKAINKLINKRCVNIIKKRLMGWTE